MPPPPAKTCPDCKAEMIDVLIMDKTEPLLAPHRHAGPLEYRLPDDRISFWTGKFPTSGNVIAFMCQSCGRIALYGAKPES